MKEKCLICSAVRFTAENPGVIMEMGKIRGFRSEKTIAASKAAVPFSGGTRNETARLYEAEK